MLYKYKDLLDLERMQIYKEICNFAKTKLLEILTRNKKLIKYGYKPHLSPEQIIEVVDECVKRGDAKITDFIEFCISKIMDMRKDYYDGSIESCSSAVLCATMYYDDDNANIQPLMLQMDIFTDDVKAFVLQDNIKQLVFHYGSQNKEIVEQKTNENKLLEEQSKCLKESQAAEDLARNAEINKEMQKNRESEKVLLAKENVINQLQSELESCNKQYEKNIKQELSANKKAYEETNKLLEESTEKCKTLESSKKLLEKELRELEIINAENIMQIKEITEKNQYLNNLIIEKEEKIKNCEDAIEDAQNVCARTNRIFCEENKDYTVNCDIDNRMELVRGLAANIRAFGFDGENLKDFSELLLACWECKFGIILYREGADKIAHALSLITNGKSATVLHIDKEYVLEDYIQIIKSKNSDVVLIKDYVGNFNEIMLFSLKELLPTTMFILSMEDNAQIKYMNDMIYKFFVVINYKLDDEKKEERLDKLSINIAKQTLLREEFIISDNIKKSIDEFSENYFKEDYYQERHKLFTSEKVVKFLIHYECKLLLCLENASEEFTSFGSVFNEEY